MIRNARLIRLLAASTLSVTACATAIDDGDAPANARDKAFDLLQRTSGAPVSMELNEAGVTRIVAMTPRFPVATHATDVAQAATNFLAANHDLYQLDAADAKSFTITRVDAEPERNMSHVTLQRTFNGIPVFQGAITVHLDGGNGVFRALGDEFYRIAPPTNRMMLTADEAAVAAGRDPEGTLEDAAAALRVVGQIYERPGRAGVLPFRGRAPRRAV